MAQGIDDAAGVAGICAGSSDSLGFWAENDRCGEIDGWARQMRRESTGDGGEVQGSTPG